MGFFSSLAGKGQAALAAMTQDAAALKSTTAMTGTLAMLALVAGADGEIEPAEKVAINGFMKASDLFEGHDRSQLATTLEGFFKKATDDFVREDLVELVAKLKGTAAAGAAMRLGVLIAAADGEVEPAEKEILRHVCGSLGLSLADFPKIAA